jgi:hypothetical protein
MVGRAKVVAARYWAARKNGLQKATYIYFICSAAAWRVYRAG